MAKYIASPWGFISGKVGGCVGSHRKGVWYFKRLSKPPNYGSIQDYKAHLRNPKHRFSPKQMNERRTCYGMLTYIIKTHLHDLIHPIWESYCRKKKPRLTGGNLFMALNLPPLYSSIPHPHRIFAPDNLPDYTKMLVSYGVLFPPTNLTASYNTQKHCLTLKWAVYSLSGVSPDDTANVAIFSPPTPQQIASFKPSGKLTLLPTPATRKEGILHLHISHISPNSIIYLYFSNSKGFSPSKASPCQFFC